MLNKSFFNKIALLFFSAAIFISCDKEFNTIGSDLVGDDNHFGFEKDVSSTVVAYNQKSGVVQSNNLPINPIGVFDNGLFGKTTANFVTQVQLKTVNPTFNNVPLSKVSSVVLSIPYFSTYLETDKDGNNKYELDSVYGNIANKLKLSIYENKFFLRDLDPAGNFEEAQKFYSDQNNDFDANKGQLLYDSSEFVFSPAEIVTEPAEEGDDKVREIPAMKLDLNKEFFYNKLIAADDINLSNNTLFKNHFRGLYFKVEELAGSSMALMNFAKGTITMTYEDIKYKTVDGVKVEDGVEEKTLVLNLTGNTVSLLQNSSTSTSGNYDAATGNVSAGDSKLYLRGGQGSVANIELFGGGNSDQLESLRSTAISNNWLINEANLVFYVDQDAMADRIDPNRIYLYDVNNNRPVYDYFIDVSANASKPKYSKSIYGGIASLSGASGSENRKAVKYKIRITEHIKNVLLKDSTNTKLGLAVSENIVDVTMASLKTPNAFTKKIPQSSVMNPLGTVLFGTVPVSGSENKKLQLEIYYTKPN